MKKYLRDDPNYEEKSFFLFFNFFLLTIFIDSHFVSKQLINQDF
jgi:hypothetical protein